MNELSKIIPLLIPIFILQIGLDIAAFINLYKRKKVRFNNKFIWVLIILFINIFGAIIYFVARGEEE